MTFKEQLNTIKQNWIIALVLLLIVLVPMFSGTTSSRSYGGGIMAESAMYAKSASLETVSYDQSFAPEVEDRKITKSAYLSTEVERGTFQESADK